MVQPLRSPYTEPIIMIAMNGNAMRIPRIKAHMMFSLFEQPQQQEFIEDEQHKHDMRGVLHQ